MSFKRLSNHVSPYTHLVVNETVVNSNTNKTYANPYFLLAKQLLADLPITPTSERIYDLTQQLHIGLLDGVCNINDTKNVDKNWALCLNTVEEYLRSIGILVTM